MISAGADLNSELTFASGWTPLESIGIGMGQYKYQEVVLVLLRAGAALPRQGTGNWDSFPAMVKCVERMRTAGGWKAYEEAYVTIFKKIFPRSPLPRLLVLRVTCYWARMGLSGSPYLPPSLLA